MRRALGMALCAAALAAAPLSAQTRLVVVSGVSGEPRIATQFHQWGLSLVEAARTRYGVADSAIVWLAEDPSKAPGRIAGRSTKEALAGALATLASRMPPSDRLLLVVIAHGASGDAPRLALPGPDLTPAELARMLAPLGDRDVGVVLAASAS
ncbi:MAG TPA: hypothetical protein VEA99_02095, partial [Gemmatimonadaceae bacterium]|nr:hypothetical protein [Gemmatimonadaceae bacterium]